MVASLLHAKQFRKAWYTGRDGQDHYELLPINGGCDVISWSSWEDLKHVGEQAGIPRSVWPEGPDFAIDASVEEIEQANAVLRHEIARFPPEIIESHHWLKRVIEYIHEGEMIFLCE
jgi:hypothetical protein